VQRLLVLTIAGHFIFYRSPDLMLALASYLTQSLQKACKHYLKIKTFEISAIELKHT